MARLTATAVRHAGPGRHGDSFGLILDVKGTGKAYWLLRHTFAGKRREMGLGPARGPDAVTLADAREAAIKARKLARSGTDPIQARNTASQAEPARVSFRQAAFAYHAAHSGAWRNPRHAREWLGSLERHAFPFLGELDVGAIRKQHVLAALQPVWSRLPETASRVRGRIESVLAFAVAHGWRDEGLANPAERRAVTLALGARKKCVEHFRALPWAEAPGFMASLLQRPEIAARALAFLVLTASRSGEVRGARWGELDLAAAVWAIPASRMKAHKEHQVPLPDAALAILAAVRVGRPDPTALVFPNRKGNALTDTALAGVLRELRPGVTATVHGFRSTFRDWVYEATDYPGELAEAALAHATGSAVERAYRRGSATERRRALMQDWADYLASKPEI